MKVWGIIATILLVISLCLNVWYYSETTNLNANVNQQLGHSYYSEYQLPPETMSELKSNIGRLAYENQQLQQDVQELHNEIQRLAYENEEYRATLTQIQQEAERAQELGMWQSLLRLIFSLL